MPALTAHPQSLQSGSLLPHVHLRDVVPLIINPCIDVFNCARASKGCSDVEMKNTFPSLP